MWHIIWLVVVVVTLIMLTRKTYSKFKQYGVKHQTPLPLLGNMFRVAFRLEPVVIHSEKLYKSFPREKFIGYYEFIAPMVLVRDLELIKKITVKDFEHFVDHRTKVDEDIEPMFGRNLFVMKGKKWREMRSTMSPAFTSSKIRLMVPLMVEVGEQMIRSLEKQIKGSGVGSVDLDCKDLLTRFANDVVASCAFGLKVDSHSEKNNTFYEMGKKATDLSFGQILTFIGYNALPGIMKILKIQLFHSEARTFFKDLVLNTMAERAKHSTFRPDMIHLLMEAKKGKLTHDAQETIDSSAGFATVHESELGKSQINRVWSEDDLVAQAVVFFIAGFETVSTAMTYLLFELGLNPDVQDRLFEEIQQNHKKNKGKFDYISIQQMKYLDMVVSETLRLWPPAIATERMCVKQYNLGRPNEDATVDYIIKEGEGVAIPIWAIHRSAEFYPEPSKFDPERFSDENKNKIKPFTYMPFGLGPRGCIGSRFALCEMKVMAYQLLLHMKVTPCEKTNIPIKLATGTINLRAQGGHTLRFKPRN